MSSKKTNGWIGIIGIVQMVFLVLKQTGLINWRWSVVLIPSWIELGILALILIIVGIVDLSEKKNK